jgi:hypothetical protein
MLLCSTSGSSLITRIRPTGCAISYYFASMAFRFLLGLAKDSERRESAGDPV